MVDLALEQALVIMTERGVGGLTVSEVARRIDVQPPSLYKYFTSLHAIYDELFARGTIGYGDAVQAAITDLDGWEPRLRAGVRAGVAWSVANPALAQLMFWRPVPEFEPSPHAFAGSVSQMAATRAEIADAVERGDLAAGTDVDEAVRMLTVLISGIVSQQMANEPRAPFADGHFSRLTDQAVDMYLNHYRPAATDKERDRANPEP
jgi:AcrR family transcriptional regulator